MMGLYSVIFLFLGILLIGLLYAKTGDNRASHHVIYAIILILFLIIFFTIHHHFQKTCAILITGNLEQAIQLIRSWGIAAPLMSLMLMIIQAIVAPLPAFLVTAANGMVFGMYWGALLSWLGALLGASACFYIARLTGKIVTEKFIHNQKTVNFIKHAGEKRGFWLILFSRLLPFISFDLVSYLAGLSGIRPWAFILGTAVGMLPATIIFTYMGREIPLMEENSPILLTITIVSVFTLVVFSLAHQARKKR